MSNGFMLISRDIQRWGWYKNSNMVHLFIHLLLEAQYQDCVYMGIELKRGQLLSGRKQLSEAIGLTEREIRTCLKRLANDQQIIVETTNKYSIITISKYDSWVSQRPANDQQTTNKDEQKRPTSDHIQINNNKEIKIKKEDTIVSKKEKSPSFDVRADLSYVEEEYSDMWNEWLDYKDEIKKQYKTQVGAKKQFTAFKNLSQGDLGKAHAIIDQSMMRNWDGLFDVKDYIPQTSQGVQFPANPRHGDRIGYDWFYDAEEERWIKDKETDSRGREFNVELGKWLI